MDNKALIIIDMLNDFFNGNLPLNNASDIVNNIKKVILFFRKNNMPVVYSNDAHNKDDYEFVLWGEHAIVGTEGAQVISNITPDIEKDYIIPKRRYSSFTGTDLNIFLKEKKINTLVLCGISTDICVRHTSYDAYINGYNIEIPKDCVSTFSDDNQRDIDYLKKVYGALIVSSSDYF